MAGVFAAGWIPWAAALDDGRLSFWVGWILALSVAAGAWWRGPASQPARPARAIDPAESALIFLLAVASRLWLRSHMTGPAFFGDEPFDSCIHPYELSLGEPLGQGGATNVLTYATYLAAYRVFGFSPMTARLVNVLVYATSVTVFAAAARTAISVVAARAMAVMTLIGTSFVPHSVYATAITFGLLPVALLTWTLRGPVRPRHAVAAAAITAASLLLYPGGFLTSVAWVGASLTIDRRAWDWRSRVALLVGTAVCAWAALQARTLATGSAAYGQWAGGSLMSDHAWRGIWVTLGDTFWSTTSWNTLAGAMPYFDPAFTGCFVVGMALALGGAHAMRAPARWSAVALAAFLATTIAAAFAGDYPGIRRAYAAMPLVVLVAAIGFDEIWRRGPRAAVGAAAAVALLCAAADVRAISRFWPLSGVYRAVADARTLIGEQTAWGQDVVIVGAGDEQYRAQHLRCWLGLDPDIARRVGSIRALSTPVVPVPLALPGRVLLLSIAPLSETQMVGLLGRAPVRIDAVAGVGAARDRIHAAYEFESTRWVELDAALQNAASTPASGATSVRNPS